MAHKSNNYLKKKTPGTLKYLGIEEKLSRLSGISVEHLCVYIYIYYIHVPTRYQPAILANEETL